MVSTKVPAPLLGRRSLSVLVLCGAMIGGAPMLTLAQSLPGLTLFGGIKSEFQLDFRLDFGGRADGWDRYRLRVPPNKMKLAVAQFAISYPDYYDGEFDPKGIEIMVGQKSVPLKEVNWNKEDHLLTITPQEAIPSGKRVEIILSNVKNPAFGGMYNFNCQVQTPGDVPILRYLGTWQLSIS